MGATALIGLGSNLGDRKGTLDAAVAGLCASEGVRVRAVSSYHETRPTGGPAGQGAFLNAAASLETDLGPVQLLALLRELEARAGRSRVIRWGERTLDLDLLLLDDQIIDTAELTVPHRWLPVRRFVLAPLAEIAPDAVDPLTGRSIAKLLANLDRRPGYIALDWPNAHRRLLYQRLVVEIPALGLNPTNDPGPDLAGSSGRVQDVAELMEWKTRALRAEVSSPEFHNDQWLLTDFWLDRLLLDLLRPDQPSQVCDRLLEVRTRTLAPTFVVAPPLFVDQPASWSELAAPSRPIGSDVPILRTRSANLDDVVEDVLAACAASRS